MTGRVEQTNNEILIQCRQQLGLDLEIVASKVKAISEYESGQSKPTFKQLDILAEIYNVPRWVFIADQLPSQFELSKSVPAFRQFSESNMDSFSIPKVRALIKKVEEFRSLVLDLREDMAEPINDFSGPSINMDDSLESLSKKVLNWLKIEGPLEFSELRSLVEKKNIFIFLTSKYNGWSHIDRTVFRGLTLFHTKLPIIIINDSDAKKAQSFSLFHELGHILRKENAIDDWEYQDNEIERWCDNFAGNCLMPKGVFLSQHIDTDSLSDIKRLANSYKVSPYACIVRLSQLGIISFSSFKNFEEQLRIEFIELQERLKARDGGPARNRPSEIISQYGNIYTSTLLQAFNNREIGLHKVAELLNIKNHNTVLDIQRML